jgi:hypothetical protein
MNKSAYKAEDKAFGTEGSNGNLKIYETKTYPIRLNRQEWDITC